MKSEEAMDPSTTSCCVASHGRMCHPHGSVSACLSPFHVVLRFKPSSVLQKSDCQHIGVASRIAHDLSLTKIGSCLHDMFSTVQPTGQDLLSTLLVCVFVHESTLEEAALHLCFNSM